MRVAGEGGLSSVSAAVVEGLEPMVFAGVGPVVLMAVRGTWSWSAVVVWLAALVAVGPWTVDRDRRG